MQKQEAGQQEWDRNDQWQAGRFDAVQQDGDGKWQQRLDAALPVHLHAEASHWLQQLAMWLQPGYATILVSKLARELPIPDNTVRHFGNVARFVAAMPGLHRVGQGASAVLQIEPGFHTWLRDQAAAAWSVGPAAAAAAAADRQRHYLQQQQQLRGMEGMPGAPPPKRQALAFPAGPAGPAAAAAAAAGAELTDLGVPAHVHAAAARWLQQLALLLDANSPEISSKDLQQLLPIPNLVYSHFRGVPGFVQWVRAVYGGLQWEGGYVSLDRGVLLQLRAEAAALGGAHQGAVGGYGGNYGAGMQRMRPAVEAEDSRPWKRQALSPAAAGAAAAAAAAADGPYPRSRGGYGLPADLPRDVYGAACRWLVQLALWLEPARPAQTIHMGELRDELPVPELVEEFFGSVSSFWRSVDGLHLDWSSKIVSLECGFHQQLRAAARDVVSSRQRCSGSS